MSTTNMERVVKRLKSWFFDTDEEAKEYIESLTFGNPNLPKDVWVQILSSNKNLSVQDIQRMCRVNSDFNELCRSGIIWERIFIRQFGQEEYDKMKRIFADVQDPLKPLLMLLTRRYYEPILPPYYPPTVNRFLLNIFEQPLTFIIIHDFEDRYLEIQLFYEAGSQTDFQRFKSRLTETDFSKLKMILWRLVGALGIKEYNIDGTEWFQRLTKIYWKYYSTDDTLILKCIYHLFSVGTTPTMTNKNIYVGTQICASCAQPASSVCGRCRQVAYCDKECQRAHYPLHSQECE